MSENIIESKNKEGLEPLRSGKERKERQVRIFSCTPEKMADNTNYYMVRLLKNGNLIKGLKYQAESLKDAKRKAKGSIKNLSDEFSVTVDDTPYTNGG
jgi:hypothetical protein